MKIISSLFLILLGWSSAFIASAHPYHTSIGEVHYNSKTNKLEIALKVFTDDLEKTLSVQAKKAIILTGSEEYKMLVSNYLKKSFAIEISGKPASFKFIGLEKEGDTQWLYLEVGATPEMLKNTKVRNQVLMDAFEDQMNILNLEINGKKNTQLFNSSDFRKPIF